MLNDTQMPVWEVFCQSKTGKPYEHVGNVHASDSEMALQNARDVYSRRGSVVGIWVVPSKYIISSTPDDMCPFFDPGNDKIYRHPNFYKIPKGVNVDVH